MDESANNVTLSSTKKALLASRLDPTTARLQDQCPLFSEIPPEVRTTIFRYALRPSHDPKKAYKEGTFYYRPTHTSSPLIATSLLLTCRRIYLEIALLLSSQNTLTYWWGRPPPGQSEKYNPVRDLELLTPEQRGETAVQIFAQQCCLEDDLLRVLADPLFRPAQLTFTLRHGDWWFWESDERLGFDAKQRGRPRQGWFLPPERDFEPGSWGAALCKVKGLKVFTLELETVVPKRAEMDAIVENAMQWTFPMADGSRLVCDPAAKKVSGWTGVNRFYEIQREEIEEERSKIDSRARLRRGWGALRRRNVDGTLGAGRSRSEADAPRLEYHVVELTWRRVGG